jgi:hypothetical protein
MDLRPQSCIIKGLTTFIVTRAKERGYHNQHPTDQFLPSAIEVFGCLHKHVNVFLHDCANAIWSFKGPKGLLFFVLVTFFIKKFQLHYKECKHPPS